MPPELLHTTPHRTAQVWFDAAEQVFYSVGPGFGTHIAFASYNKFYNNPFKCCAVLFSPRILCTNDERSHVHRDCVWTAGMNLFTSVFSGFVLFCYLGFMAKRKKVLVEAMELEGPGVAFQVYPEAIGTLRLATLWSVAFFVMLLTLGLDSAVRLLV